MQDRHRRIVEIFLLCTAGPYIGSIATGSSQRQVQTCPLFPRKRRLAVKTSPVAKCHFQTLASRQTGKPAWFPRSDGPCRSRGALADAGQFGDLFDMCDRGGRPSRLGE